MSAYDSKGANVNPCAGVNECNTAPFRWSGRDRGALLPSYGIDASDFA